MTEYVEVQVSDLFRPTNGRPVFIRDYMDNHIGRYPVYSASLLGIFGSVDSFDYEGDYLTWVMNGYGGRIQEVNGRFSANRDRGVFVPKTEREVPDLTYLRFAMEPKLVELAVGRVVDGRRNDYTKIYPDVAGSAVISLPIKSDGAWDFPRMREIGDRLRKIETAQSRVRRAREDIARASVLVPCVAPSRSVGLADKEIFDLSIGNRILRNAHVNEGVPAYSANVRTPFGKVDQSNLSSFDAPSLIWGIDGVFDWNFIPAGFEFANTDHCGRLQILDADIDAEYLMHALRATRSEYGFDRVFRASLKNIRDTVEVVIPTNPDGTFSLERQQRLAARFRQIETTSLSSIAALDEVLDARLTTEL